MDPLPDQMAPARATGAERAELYTEAYASAHGTPRQAAVLAQYTARTGLPVDGATLAAADLSLLTAPTEATLMLKLAAYPDMLSSAAADLAPHDVAFYLRDLAAAFHSWYGAERFLIDDAALAAARMALLAATRQVLRNALAMMGVSAPDLMQREPLAEGAGRTDTATDDPDATAATGAGNAR